MTPDQILDLALQKERQAHALYGKMALQCSVDFVKELLLTLQNEEYKHIQMIQHMHGRLVSGKDIV